MREGLKVRAVSEDYNNCVKFLLFYQRYDGKRVAAKPVDLVFDEVADDVICEPTFFLRGEAVREFLQEMANLCASFGVMPKGKPPLQNELDAVKYHLKDFRRLVFEKKGGFGK